MLLENHGREIHKEEDALLVTWEGREKPAGGEVCDVVYKSSSKVLHVERVHGWFGRGDTS